MPDLLPSYTWDAKAGRYRSSATGQFVGRQRVLNLIEGHINETAKRMGDLTTAFYEGKLSAVVWADQMRVEQKRLTLQNEALGAGGIDRLTNHHYGRAGADLRSQYAKIAGTARDMAEGKITLPQALARVNGYAGEARAHFFLAERETSQRSSLSMVIIERRVLGNGKHCRDCVDYYGRGWQLFGALPPPGVDSVCGGACRCSMLRVEVPANETGDWIGTKR